MSSARLRARIPEARPLGRARWPGMRLVFNKVGADGSGKANLIEDLQSEAWGVLFSIPHADWESLDEFEPGYVRGEYTVTRDTGEDLRAQVYLGTGLTRETPPHDWYREHVQQGAIEHGLPGEIIRMIHMLQRSQPK